MSPDRSPKSRAGLLFCGSILLPVLTGCSTLGIAETKDVTAMEARIDNENQQINTRLEASLANQQELQAQVNQLMQSQSATAAQVDSLVHHFEIAREWLKDLNIDSLSEDVSTIHRVSAEANDRSRKVTEFYVEWIRNQHETLGKQLQALEASLKESAPPPSSEGSRGQDDSGDSGGGS